MTATHPSTATGVADRMALALEELLVATSPDGILGRLCAPLFWVIGKLMERRMRREMEKLVATLRDIAKNGLPVPVLVEPVALAPRSDRVGGTGDSRRSDVAYRADFPSEGDPSSASGAWDEAGAQEWRDPATDADAARGGLRAGSAESCGASTPCVEPKAAQRHRVAPRHERRPAKRALDRAIRIFSGNHGVSTFGRSPSDADGGRARSGFALASS